MKVEPLIEFIEGLKLEAIERYKELDNEEARAVYACQNMICSMILNVIQSFLHSDKDDERSVATGAEKS